MNKLQFSKNGTVTALGWNDHTLFPTEETNEETVRSDMQLFHDQTKTAFNGLIDALESTTDGNSGADQIRATALSGGTATTVQGELEELATSVASLDAYKHTHSNKAVLDTISAVQTVIAPSTTAVPSATAVINAISSGGNIPPGLICMWSGASSNIPTGWYLCDGTNNTPNLTDKFIIGAGSTYAVGTTGGEATHTLTINEMPSHHHINQLPLAAWSGTGTNIQTGADYSSVLQVQDLDTGGGQAHNNLPPYYALCFIMKG